MRHLTTSNVLAVRPGGDASLQDGGMPSLRRHASSTSARAADGASAPAAAPAFAPSAGGESARLVVCVEPQRQPASKRTIFMFMPARDTGRMHDRRVRRGDFVQLINMRTKRALSVFVDAAEQLHLVCAASAAEWRLDVITSIVQGPLSVAGMHTRARALGRVFAALTVACAAGSEVRLCLRTTGRLAPSSRSSTVLVRVWASVRRAPRLTACRGSVGLLRCDTHVPVAAYYTVEATDALHGTLPVVPRSLLAWVCMLAGLHARVPRRARAACSAARRSRTCAMRACERACRPPTLSLHAARKWMRPCVARLHAFSCKTL
jgi:hypothetical protein